MQTFVLVLALILVGALAAEIEVFDPFNVFCGSRSCYDVLGLPRTSTTKEIRKAYRELSKTMHPDKVHPDKRVNVTAEFIVLKKAQSVRRLLFHEKTIRWSEFHFPFACKCIYLSLKCEKVVACDFYRPEILEYNVDTLYSIF